VVVALRVEDRGLSGRIIWAEDPGSDAALAETPGLPRRPLAARSRSIAGVDLPTAAAHYLYHRPA